MFDSCKLADIDQHMDNLALNSATNNEKNKKDKENKHDNGRRGGRGWRSRNQKRRDHDGATKGNNGRDRPKLVKRALS